MKKAFKIVIPLFLVLAVLIAAIWFFGFKRSDMTNSFLLSQAENMAKDGRYNRAIRYYTWATKLEPQRDDIYIKLSETYAAADNFTKAEYTLVKAISNQPDMTELYVALCRTYVAQGKLMDAVQMLDRTTSSTVKAELDAMRPSAPTIKPEGGYYTEYIDISVASEADTIYATFDGDDALASVELARDVYAVADPVDEEPIASLEQSAAADELTEETAEEYGLPVNDNGKILVTKENVQMNYEVLDYTCEVL